MAEYALDSRTFYRGIKSLWWRIAESAVSAGETGTVRVGPADVDGAIGRAASGRAGGDGKAEPAVPLDEDDADAPPGTGFAGG